MTVQVEGSDWASRAAALAEELVAADKLSSPEWHKAVLEVPRHVFVPDYYVHRDGGMVTTGATDGQGRAQWLEMVYSNTALITKIAPNTDGTPPVFLSSSSTPGLMTRMLEALDVHDGQRVLEIGTGTGYNAALLSHRLGAANVFSIDIEPDLIDLARTRLAELGYYPTLMAGDGAAGLPEHTPFDRIIATCSVPAIPWAWVEQTTLGGIILTDIKLGLNAGNLILLTRTGPNRAEGRFDAGQAAFMHLRHIPGFDGRVPYTRAPHDNPATEHTTTLDPRTPWTNPVVWFLTALRIGPHYRLGYTGSNPRNGPEAVCLSTPDGSRSEIALAPNTDGSHTVRNTGHTRLWSHLEDAHHLWDAAGRPDWPRLGLAVTPHTQTLYADEPDNTIATLSSGNQKLRKESGKNRGCDVRSHVASDDVEGVG
ncbi:MAG: methyltransferase domain-containing protein [Pseudonocardiaceae bacterium]